MRAFKVFELYHQLGKAGITKVSQLVVRYFVRFILMNSGHKLQEYCDFYQSV
jgi:hypothetical protein